MPQDIPVEASETLAFTPKCLEKIEGAPKFILRTPTPRDKRFHRRLYVEEGVRSHTLADIRSEVLAGLKALWTEDAYAEHVGRIKEFWEAGDQFAALQKVEPDAVWDFDPDVEAAINDLTRRVAEGWPPLRRILADNAEYSDLAMPLLIAVVVKSWTGLPDAKRDLDRGYLTMESAEALRDALFAYEKANGMVEGAAWVELFLECSSRMTLGEDEAGNSASPSPSGTTPPVSSETNVSAMDGTSPASASAEATPEAA